MTHKMVVSDDLDGTSDAKTVRFSLDGQSYEIDLATDNIEALHDVLKPYIDAGRRLKPSARKQGGRQPSQLDQSAVREWAKENGHTVSDRGRIPARVVDAFVQRQRDS